ncbi:histidine triad nucleotide-binding protein [Candidatus Marsarchaeota G1 archaeon BE_D]|jgi:Diadenosine tetraphosphate (Ap4A) hydrolase and other HIT family hydrolases|uniref:Histidine triad nucleotide-binding protein n=1 Tax=Candidatus Marsarchaeota G1 archaeon BE_D TaxID=1978156 RepID=A0A2R6AI05_9ARCH|nr:MAG: histidine triad nucleotide-binding protein [Candidatus Marsarchaeota G1 archaeon BE_D]
MTEECVFCKIVENKLPSAKVYENSDFVVIKDINPVAPIHYLVLPKRHIPSVLKIDQEFPSNALFETIKRVAQKEGFSERGFRIVINTGPDALQSVNHLHVHIIAGRKLGWPPG